MMKTYENTKTTTKKHQTTPTVSRTQGIFQVKALSAQYNR